MRVLFFRHLINVGAHCLYFLFQDGKEKQAVPVVQLNLIRLLADLSVSVNKWEVVDMILPHFIESLEEGDALAPSLLRLRVWNLVSSSCICFVINFYHLTYYILQLSYYMYVHVNYHLANKLNCFLQIFQLLDAISLMACLGFEKSYRETIVLMTRSYLDKIKALGSAGDNTLPPEATTERVEVCFRFLMGLQNMLSCRHMTLLPANCFNHFQDSSCRVSSSCFSSSQPKTEV